MCKLLIPVLLAAGMVAAPNSSTAADIEFKPEIRICAEGTGTLIKGGSCWAYDLTRGVGVWEYQLCLGLVVDGGVLFAGFEGQIMVCGTLTVPAELATGKDKETWKKVAGDRLRAYLADPASKASLRKVLKRDFNQVQVRPIREADAETTREIRDAVRNSSPK